MKVWRLPFKPVTNQPVTIAAAGTFRELSEVRHLAVFTPSLVLRWVCRDDNKPLPPTTNETPLFLICGHTWGVKRSGCQVCGARLELVWLCVMTEEGYLFCSVLVNVR